MIPTSTPPPAPRSSATPPPLPPLRYERTSVAPYSWMRRHLGGVAAVAPLISGAVAWGAGVLQGVDPVTAFQKLGVPVAIIVLLVMALVWTYLVFIPQLQAAGEKTRQLLIEAQSAEIAQIVQSHAEDRQEHAEDRAAWLRTQQETQGLLRAIAKRLEHLEEIIGTEPTNPADPQGRSSRLR